MLSIWPVRLLNVLFTAQGPGGLPMSLSLELDSRVLVFTAAVTLSSGFTMSSVEALNMGNKVLNVATTAVVDLSGRLPADAADPEDPPLLERVGVNPVVLAFHG